MPSVQKRSPQTIIAIAVAVVALCAASAIIAMQLLGPGTYAPPAAESELAKQLSAALRADAASLKDVHVGRGNDGKLAVMGDVRDAKEAELIRGIVTKVAKGQDVRVQLNVAKP